MDVSVCIVNWNTRELLYRCLDSIRSKTQGLRYEVVVVDNASSDGSPAMVRECFPEFQLIASSENLGFARGSNLAAQRSTGKYVLYLNPDTELVSNAIFGMYAWLEEHADYGAVGCMLLNSDGSIQHTCASSFPSPRNELCSLLCLDRLFPGSEAFSSRELNYWNHQDSRSVECLSGACMMVRRPLVERLGGFDESLFMYGEDLDICWALRNQGAMLYYLASETIYHHEGAGSRKRGRSFAPLLQRQANCYFIGKRYGSMRALLYRTAVSMGSALRLCGAVLLFPLFFSRHKNAVDRSLLFLGKHCELFLWSIGLKEIRPR